MFHEIVFGIRPTVVICDGPYIHAQDFAVLATLDDALAPIYALSWGGPFLAAGGQDRKVRVYDGTEVTGHDVLV